MNKHLTIVPEDCNTLADVVSCNFEATEPGEGYRFTIHYWPHNTDKVVHRSGMCTFDEKAIFQKDWRYMQAFLNGDLDRDGYEPDGYMPDDEDEGFIQDEV